MKTTKMYCPTCGRYLGESKSTDETSIEKVLTTAPKSIRKKQAIYEVKCNKCKKNVFISVEFID